MKYVLYVCTVLSLLVAMGCASRRPRAPRAVLMVQSVTMQDSSPSSISSLKKADAQFAVAKVIGHAQDPQFQAKVANELGVSPETVGKVVFQEIMEARLLELRADLSDRALASKLVNAMATKLAEDFRDNPDVEVRVTSLAPSAAPTSKQGEE